VDDLASAQAARPRPGIAAVRRRRGTALAAGLLALVGAGGMSHGTHASFVGETRNGGNTFALTSLYAPGALTTAPAGHSVDLTWTPGRNGNGYRILSAPAPDPLVNDCTGASFTELATQAGTSYTHALGTPQGTWRCYQVQTAYASWTSVVGNPIAGARLGFVASIVDFVNGGNGSRVDTGDTVTFTFNQPVDPATGPQVGNTICWVNDRIVLGSTQTGDCTAGDTSPRLGVVTGGTISRNHRYAVVWTWSNGNRTLTATLGTRLSGSGSSSNVGSWTFTPTPDPAFLRSATGGFHVCDANAGGSNCLPAVAGL
jgi:hypothetical protein